MPLFLDITALKCEGYPRILFQEKLAAQLCPSFMESEHSSFAFAAFFLGYLYYSHYFNVK